LAGFHPAADEAVEAFRGPAVVFLHTTRRGMPLVWSDFGEVRQCSMPNSAKR
jgi:shikimate kinase